jgi:hypothetical protein
VTSDLVFPVMFGVADEDVAARIIARLSAQEFWCEAGIRTVPRNGIDYGPTHGYGLLGGVWVGVAFWYAFAAARANVQSMASALKNSFRHYSTDPRRNNTVPGQFSEWLHGETLVNQGMMLSPWFPPRYLWAAIEGVAGLDLTGGTPTIEPRLSAQWKWTGVRDVPLAGDRVSWFIVRAPDLRLYTNATFRCGGTWHAYRTDLSSSLRLEGQTVVGLCLGDGEALAIFVGNTSEHAVAVAVAVDGLRGTFVGRTFNSLRGAWVDGARYDAADLARGIPLELESGGFCLSELRQVG